jgi:serine/threonine protein phosphatase PrpC
MNLINRFFGWIDSLGKKPRPAPEKPTPEDHVLEQPIWTLDGPESIAVGTALSTGIVRSHNEDSLFTLLGNLVGNETYPNFGLFLVADGMGGHRAGEVASSISVRTTAHHLTESTILPLFDLELEDSLLQLQELIRIALEDANHTVAAKVPGGGTTLTAAILFKDKIVIGHVGDSRAYIIKDGASKVITRDHSLVERLRELGQLTLEEAASHPQRNVLYRAIGQGSNLEVDTFTQPVPNGGYLLLCSDGLWAEVPEQEIQRIVSVASHPQEACDELVRAANEAGGPDNITAVLVRFPSSE